MREIILVDRYDTVQVIQEQKELWVCTTLILLGIPEEDLEKNKIESLSSRSIEIWDHLDNGDVEILQNNILIAKWYAPQLTPKYDDEQKIYYEIQLDYESVLDNEFHSPGEE